MGADNDTKCTLLDDIAIRIILKKWYPVDSVKGWTVHLNTIKVEPLGFFAIILHYEYNGDLYIGAM